MNKYWMLFALLCMSTVACGSNGKEDTPPSGTEGPAEMQRPDLPTEVISNEKLVIYPAPQGYPLNSIYVVEVDGQAIPVYNARVGVGDKKSREEAFGNARLSANTYDNAGMAYFDLKQGSATIKITVDRNIGSAKILPSSAGIVGDISGKTVSFTVSKPQNLTIDINGEYIKSLHLFVNPEDKDVPSPNDPNVIYFGPGIHEVSHMTVGSGKTVYVAGGAVIKGIISAGEQGSLNPNSGLMNYKPTFVLEGDNIVFRGRGIVDQTECPTHARNLILMRGSNMVMEGVILHNSSVWTVPVRVSRNVTVDNIKLFGYRSNADGIDICSSFDVTVQNCFIRTSDDLIVVKTPKESGPAARILAKNCVLWNGIAHALSVGAEITKDMEDVVFIDCDIIHDHCREWSLRVYQSDGGRVKNIRFENLRIEESVRFASVWIGRNVWTTSAEAGHIEDVVFKNISAESVKTLNVEIKGFDADHAVGNVLFENVTLNGRSLRTGDIEANEFVSGVVVTP